jgi:predicted nucleic acid-binding protein
LSDAEQNGPDEPRTLRAVLDSDIIFSRVLHELLGRLAYDLDYFDLCWSDDLLDEAERVLREEKDPPIQPERAAQWVNYMRQAFPDCRFDITTLPETLNLELLTSDPDDHHVAALAVVASADYLFSHDTKFKADGLSAHGVALTKPDNFLLKAFADDPVAIVHTVQRQLAAWSAGTKTLQELLEAFHRADAKNFANAVAAHLGVTLDPSRPVER